MFSRGRRWRNSITGSEFDEAADVTMAYYLVWIPHAAARTGKLLRQTITNDARRGPDEHESSFPRERILLWEKKNCAYRPRNMDIIFLSRFRVSPKLQYYRPLEIRNLFTRKTIKIRLKYTICILCLNTRISLDFSLNV